MAESKSRTTPSRIIGLQFSILSPEEIRKSSVANIVSRDTYVNNKPVIGGLFDPRMGVLDPGLICPTDGLNYMKTPGYFGHIELARPIFYIQYLHTIVKILRCVCLKCSKLLIDKTKFDYLLKLRFKDMAAYREVLGVIVELPAVSQTHTYVVMEHVKEDDGVPVFG